MLKVKDQIRHNQSAGRSSLLTTSIPPVLGEVMNLGKHYLAKRGDRRIQLGWTAFGKLWQVALIAMSEYLRSLPSVRSDKVEQRAMERDGNSWDFFEGKDTRLAGLVRWSSSEPAMSAAWQVQVQIQLCGAAYIQQLTAIGLVIEAKLPCCQYCSKCILPL